MIALRFAIHHVRMVDIVCMKFFTIQIRAIGEAAKIIAIQTVLARAKKMQTRISVTATRPKIRQKPRVIKVRYKNCCYPIYNIFIGGNNYGRRCLYQPDLTLLQYGERVPFTKRGTVRRAGRRPGSGGNGGDGSAKRHVRAGDGDRR